jgi:predicted alpha/beta-hydrolase family hydrolase
MTDGPRLIVAGGGSVAVSTDALVADSQRLRALAVALPAVAIGLGTAASLSGRAEVVALSSWRLREADAALGAARHQLTRAIEECDRLADSLDAAATAYGLAEQESVARFIASAEAVATASGVIVGGGMAGHRLLALLTLLLTGGRLRELMGETMGPNDIELPGALNRMMSDPRVIATLRALVMASDDVVGGIADIPPPSGTSDVGITALVVLAIGAMSGLFSSAPVTTTAYGSATPTAPATTIAERAARIPNAVSGDVPQVRIDRYSAPGTPDLYEVQIGGTVDFSPVAKSEPFDTTSNLELTAGLPAGAAEGVRQAMAMAGVTEHSRVVFTGHSQGGLIASVLAAAGEYDVRGLVTFGAPAGQVDIPASVPALIIENTDDVVPSLGGMQGNRDALLVSARAFPGALPAQTLPAHRIEAYIATARAIDLDAQSGAVVAYRERLAALTADYVEGTSQQYLVTRQR